MTIHAATTQETLALVKGTQQLPNDEIAKSWSQSSTATMGITAYDLEAPAKNLYPVITPLRNRIPRVGAKGGTQANWRAITGINTGNAGIGISEGNRGAVMASTVTEYLAAYRGFGLEDYVTFEADMSAEGFQDLKALAALGLLRSTMIGEERMILGGNTSTALGTTPTPTVTDVTTGGSLAANTAYSVICVALTHDGFLASSVANGLPTSGNRTLADGTTEAYAGGTATKSTAGTVTTANDSNATHCLRASVTAVKGAVAYAWYVGASGSEKLNQITTINSVLVTAASDSGAQACASYFTADKSNNSLHFDGLLTQICKTGSGAYYKALATGTAGTGTALTADGLGGISEIDTALQSFWDNYRLSPTDIYVSAQEQKNISAKILTGSSTAAQRFVFNAEQGALAGGVMVKSYLNKFAMDGATEIPIRLHPNMPAGTIMFYCDQIPYPLSNVSNVVQMKMRRDYYQIEWPLRTRKYEYGVYADGVLQNYFPPAFGMITNIANG